MNLLERQAPARNLSMFGNLILGAFVVGIMASPFVAPRTMKMCGDGKLDDAKWDVQRFANEAYPQWRRTYGDGCPHSVYELTEFLEGAKTVDPWGNRYQVLCTNGRVIVVSTGEDGTPDTNDDLRSDR